MALSTFDKCVYFFSFRRSAVASLRGTSTVSDVTAYGVASVYTPPANRRRGYAQHMMRLVHWLLRPRSPTVDATFPVEWGAPPDTSMLQKLGMANATFSVLYSDVGRDFYQNANTATRPYPDITSRRIRKIHCHSESTTMKQPQ